MAHDPKKIHCGFCSWRTNRVYMTKKGEIRGQDTAFDRLRRHVEDHHPERLEPEPEPEPVRESDSLFDSDSEYGEREDFTGELSWDNIDEGW
ncbi:MAG: hypothetical protein ACPGQF_11440 [Akkermansiaceae bacterium]